MFGGVGYECGVAGCGEGAGVDAARGVCGDALATSSRGRASGAVDLLGGDGHLLGVYSEFRMVRLGPTFVGL